MAHAVAFGGMSPSRLVLRPGQAAVVRVSARVPAGAGDSSGSVVFTPSGGGPVSVPVTLRGLVPTGLGVNGKFSGVLTGGNGRAPGEGQVAAYSFSVPSDPPEWIVPTMTHSVSATVTSASAPVMFDFEPFPGDPDEVSSSGRTATATYPLGPAVTPVTQGLWFTVPAEVGPYPAAGAPRTTVNAAMSAVTHQFDTSATPSTGDFWRFAVTPLAETATYNLFPVNPGQTRVISLTVRPSAPAGTVVRGMLYIDDFVDSLQFLSGSQLVAVPYSYTVG